MGQGNDEQTLEKCSKKLQAQDEKLQEHDVTLQDKDVKLLKDDERAEESDVVRARLMTELSERRQEGEEQRSRDKMELLRWS